jgi:hypothetical protein
VTTGAWRQVVAMATRLATGRAGPMQATPVKRKGRGKWAAPGPGRRAVREGKKKEKEEEQGGPAEDSAQTDFWNRNTFGYSNHFYKSIYLFEFKSNLKFE